MSLVSSHIQFMFRLPYVWSCHMPDLLYVSAVASCREWGMVLTEWSLRLSVHVLIPLTKCCPDAVHFSLVLREGGYKIYRLQLWLSSMMRWKCGNCLTHGISQDRWEGGVTLGWAELVLGRLCTCQRESFRPKCGLHFLCSINVQCH